MKTSCVAALFLCASLAHGESVKQTIVMFGDSTTASRKGVIAVYSELIQSELRKRGYRANVINAGVPGNTTQDARARFEQDVLARHPSLVAIQFGINDSAVDVWKTPPATGPRVDLDTFRENLSYFIRQLRRHHTKVILMTPNPLCWTDRLRLMYGKKPYRPNREDGLSVTLDGYVDALRKIAASKHVPLVDVNKAMRSQPEGACLLLMDGMHPNEQGHRLVADLLLQAVIQRLQ